MTMTAAAAKTFCNNNHIAPWTFTETFLRVGVHKRVPGEGVSGQSGVGERTRRVGSRATVTNGERRGGRGRGELRGG